MMSMLDYFAPDINSTSMRSVYPTADGGTTASAGGGMNQSTNLMVTSGVTGESGIATTTTPDALSGNADAGKGLVSWLGVLALLLATVFIARKAGGPEDFRNIRPTFYNFLAVTLTAIVGIWGLKVLATRFKVPGVSAMILSV